MKPLESLRRHRSWLVLGVALICGGVAAFGARGYIDDQVAVERHRLQPQRDEVEIVVARRDLHRGDRVAPETMAVRRIPREFVPGTAVLPERFEQHLGARLTVAMRSGEPLLAATLESVDGSAFSTRLREGVRAMTVAVDEVNALSGMLQPGDRIDLQISVRPPPQPGTPPAPEVTTSLMQDILVLATGRQVRPGTDESTAGRHFTAITVEVTPDQAQRLIVAQRGGRLTALLRNRDDRQSVPPRALDIHALIGVQAPPPPPARRTAPEVLIGGKGPLAAQLADAARLAAADAATGGTAASSLHALVPPGPSGSFGLPAPPSPPSSLSSPSERAAESAVAPVAAEAAAAPRVPAAPSAGSSGSSGSSGSRAERTPEPPRPASALPSGPLEFR